MAHDDFVVGTVGRITKLKGHDDLLAALSIELQQNPRLKMLWVGDGPDRLELQRKASVLGIDQQLIVTGMQPPERVPFYVAAMDLLAHPSYREGFPLAIIHAMLSGIPTIAYDVDGPGEICVQGQTGFLLRKGDTEELRQSIMWLQGDREACRRFGARGKEIATCRCSHRRMMSEIESSYEEVIRGG